MIQVILPPPLVEVTLPIPEDLSQNARLHHHARARKVKALRVASGWAIKAAMARVGVPRLPRVVERSTFFWPDLRRRDQDNALARMKAVWDGAIDAGLLEDDHQMTHLPVRFSLDRGRSRVEVQFFAVDISFVTKAEL